MSIERNGKHVYLNGQTGNTTTAYEKRNELAQLGLGVAAYVGDHIVILCPFCFGPMTHNGSSVDHLVSIKQLKSDLGWSDEKATETVGHPSNMLQGCSGCNSSKKQADLFDWWRSDNSKSYLSPYSRDRVLAVLDSVYQHTSKTRLTHFAFGSYDTIVLQIQRRVVG